MLTLRVEAGEYFDSDKQEFINVKEREIRLEHSLVSISKWESEWEKPFLNSEKSNDELLDYIRCMTISQNIDESVYKTLSIKNIEKVNVYINAKHTATFFSDELRKEGSSRRSSEIVTSELIYYWMIAYNVPMECEKWHINRLLTLIKICSIKNQTPKKLGRNELMRRNAALNAARRQAMHSKG